jgi:hypothetical protein
MDDDSLCESQDSALRSVLEFANKKYHSVTLDFGDEDKLVCGSTHIKRSDIFSASKQENALAFVQNLQKIQQAKSEGREPLDITKTEKYNSTMFTNMERVREEHDDTADFSQQLTFRGAFN